MLGQCSLITSLVEWHLDCQPILLMLQSCLSDGIGVLVLFARKRFGKLRAEYFRCKEFADLRLPPKSWQSLEQPAAAHFYHGSEDSS